MELGPGLILGGYRLVERAGAGGMAVVWRAYQPSLERYVAVKVLSRSLATQPGFLDRFRREALAIARTWPDSLLYCAVWQASRSGCGPEGRDEPTAILIIVVQISPRA